MHVGVTRGQSVGNRGNQHARRGNQMPKCRVTGVTRLTSMQPKNYIQLFVPVTYAKVWVTGVNRSSSMQQEEQIIFSMMPKLSVG